MEQLIGSAKLYLAALQKLGSARSQAEVDAAKAELVFAQRHLQESVLDVETVVWLAHLDKLTRKPADDE